MAASSSMFNERMTSKELNRAIAEQLQPNEDFHREVNQDMDFLAQYLKNESGLKVAEVKKGGSLSKGTAIRGKADLDIVLFLNDFRDMEDFKRRIKSTLSDLESRVKTWIRGSGYERVEVDGRTSHALKMRIRKNRSGDFIDVDLLPAMDLLKTKGKQATYQELRRQSDRDRQYFSASLVPLQTAFVMSEASTPSVKALIRLVKHWRKTQFQERSYPKLPTSYVLELLTIYAWQQAGSPQSFDTRKAFKSVLSMLVAYASIDAKWEKNYRVSDYALHQQPGSAFILDPANPFNNVCARFEAWPEVSKKADETMRQGLLRDVQLDKLYGRPCFNWN